MRPPTPTLSDLTQTGGQRRASHSPAYHLGLDLERAMVRSEVWWVWSGMVRCGGCGVGGVGRSGCEVGGGDVVHWDMGGECKGGIDVE